MINPKLLLAFADTKALLKEKKVTVVNHYKLLKTKLTYINVWLTVLALYYCLEGSAGINLFRVNIRNTRIMWEICSTLTIRKSERRH